jgi:hypothetical protein
LAGQQTWSDVAIGPAYAINRSTAHAPRTEAREVEKEQEKERKDDKKSLLAGRRLEEGCMSV